MLSVNLQNVHFMSLTAMPWIEVQTLLIILLILIKHFIKYFCIILLFCIFLYKTRMFFRFWHYRTAKYTKHRRLGAGPPTPGEY
jgi:hypothetical protein